MEVPVVSMRARSEPQFFNIGHLEWEVRGAPAAVEGLTFRTLSRDNQTEAATLFVRFPPGWRKVVRTDEATTEVFLLSGDLALEDQRVGSCGYIVVPRNGTSVTLDSERGAEGILWWSPTLPAVDGARPRVTSAWDEPWHEGVLTGLPYGRRFKVLRDGDILEGPVQGGPSGFLRLNHWIAGYAAPNEHKHGVWEELIFLHGDWLTLERGLVASGSYIGNPPGWWHGPLASRFGALALVHSDRPLDLTLREHDGGAEFTERYLHSASLGEQPEHAGLEALEPYLPLSLREASISARAG
jgi:hypothetical protein